MKIKKLIEFSLTLSLTLSFISCDSYIETHKEYRYKKLPQTQTTFERIVTTGWDKNVYNIQNLFPGGKFYDGEGKNQIAKQYVVNAELTDIRAEGRLSFSQLGDENLIDATGQVIRMILIEVQQEGELGQKHKDICKFIENNFKNATKSKYLDEAKAVSHIYETEYRLLSFDDKGDVFIGIDLDKSENLLHISITHSIIVNVL